VLLGSVGDGQTLNRYAFVTGQPVNWVDPFGLFQVIDEYGNPSAEYKYYYAWPSNAEEYEQAVKYALSAYNNMVKGCYSKSKENDMFIRKYDRNFVFIYEPLVMSFKNKWKPVFSIHGEGYESSRKIPNTDFVLKFYADPDRGNILAIVTPTDSLLHYLQAPLFVLGLHENITNAQVMMSTLKECQCQ